MYSILQSQIVSFPSVLTNMENKGFLSLNYVSILSYVAIFIEWTSNHKNDVGFNCMNSEECGYKPKLISPYKQCSRLHFAEVSEA
jgi:hypothetical protein